MGEHYAAFGATRAGKTSAMLAALEEYAEEHPLGKMHDAGGGLILMEPGPDVIKGEVIRPELEAGSGDDA